jgi:hypothetical protein
MALTQTGATYPHRAYLMGKDPYLVAALDSLASADQNIGNHVNASPQASKAAPSAPAAINLSAKNGFGSVAITHNNPPAGTAYLIEYSTTPNFQNPIRIDNGVSQSFQQYLKGQTLYFRAASTFYTSPNSPWVYFGGQANPTPVSF